MATIEWRKGKRGKYAYLQWSDNEGQHRESLGAISEHEAETQRLGKEFEQRTGKKVISSAPLVGVVATMYCAWHSEQYPTSHFRTKQIIDDHILPAFQYVAADQLGVRQVERWGQDRNKVVSASSAAKEVRTLKAMLNWAIRNEVIDFAPATKAVPPQDVTSNPMTWYSMEQLQALYTASPSLRKAQWQFMANTGIRRNEAHHLPREQIVRGVARVCSNPEARTKSRKWREIPLSANARGALAVLLEDNDTEYVFPIASANSLSLAFSDDAKAAEIGGSLHCLRHSFGTHHAIKGTPVKVIQELMGHASITTTMKYLHVAEEHRKKAFEGFEL